MDKKLKQSFIKLKLTDRKLGIVAKYKNFESIDKFLNKIAEVLSTGIQIIELSGENLTDKEFLDCGKKIKQLCEMFESTLLIRNRADIAYLSSADGVILEQNSLDIHSARELVGEDILVGIYTNSKDELLSSVKDGADFISVGNIISTPTEPVTLTGLEYAKWVSENTLLPVLACGEFNTNHCQQLKSIGITNFIIDKTVLNSISPNTVTVNYLDIL